MIFLVAFFAAALAALDEQLAPRRARRARLRAERAELARQGEAYCARARIPFVPRKERAA